MLLFFFSLLPQFFSSFKRIVRVPIDPNISRVFLPSSVFSLNCLSCRGVAPCQLYVNGELVGGVDILKEMKTDGPLAPQLGIRTKVWCLSLDLRFRCDLSFVFPHTDVGLEVEGDVEIDVDADGVGDKCQRSCPSSTHDASYVSGVATHSAADALLSVSNVVVPGYRP